MSEHTFKVKSEIIKQKVDLFYFSSINIIFSSCQGTIGTTRI